MCVRPGCVHRPRPYGWVWPAGDEVQQLQHQTVTHQVRRRHPSGGSRPISLRRHLVGWVDLTIEREAEQLAVEKRFDRSRSVTHCPTWLNATLSPPHRRSILARALVGRHTLAAEVAVVAREASAGLEIETPVVQAAREDAVRRSRRSGVRSAWRSGTTVRCASRLARRIRRSTSAPSSRGRSSTSSGSCVGA